MTKLKNILEAKNLVKHFDTKKGVVHAVDGVSFSLEKGKTIGLVGESGCGKSTVARSILRLLDMFSGKLEGQVLFDGEYLLNNGAVIDKDWIREKRKDMQMVFQDPYSSLNPRMSVGNAVKEPLAIYKIGTKKQRQDKVAELFNEVGLEDYHMKRFPHEFSGGQRQRVGVARALALEPKLIVADEPISALDVSIQAQIINLFKQLQESRNLSYIFISHDLNIVENICDAVAVMYLGKIVEYGAKEELYNNPKHPYTKALLDATPVADPDLKREKMQLKGEIPSPIDLPSGCRFHTRCPYVKEECKNSEPEPTMVENRSVSCHFSLN